MITSRARQLGRLIWLCSLLLWAAVELLWLRCLRRPSRLEYARWMSQCCRRILRCLGVALQWQGAPPPRGLLVSNHLGYLDILVLGAVVPMVFVSKSEVASWPVIGWFARQLGTLFVRRTHRTDVQRLTTEMLPLLEQGLVVVVFPEGTSTGGDTVRPFFSALVEPATQPGIAATPAYIRYELEEGDVSEEVCYWRDMTFGPHLFNLLSKRAILANVRFGEPAEGCADRKALAAELHRQVLSLGGKLPWDAQAEQVTGAQVLWNSDAVRHGCFHITAPTPRSTAQPAPHS